MRIGGRKLGLLTAALAAGVLAWYAPPPGSDEIASPASKRSSDSKGSSSVRLRALPERAAVGEPRGDLFAPQTWGPPATTAVAPPLAPSVPPNPYSVAGTMIQDGVASVFLVTGDRIYEAAPGIELDGGYRVESISSDHVVLIYVPLGVKQSLPFSTSLGAQVAAVAPPPAAPLSATPADGVQAATLSQAPAKAARLRWQGPDTVRAGSSFTVALHVSSEQQVRATPMQLRFEPELLEALAVRAGKFFGQGSFAYRANPDGTIFVGASGRGAAPGADAELVVLTFRPRRAGATAQVSLGAVALQGLSGLDLSHEGPSNFRTSIQ